MQTSITKTETPREEASLPPVPRNYNWLKHARELLKEVNFTYSDQPNLSIANKIDWQVLQENPATSKAASAAKEIGQIDLRKKPVEEALAAVSKAGIELGSHAEWFKREFLDTCMNCSEFWNGEDLRSHITISIFYAAKLAELESARGKPQS